ncbi:hypothetical protein ACUL41_16730 [Virgibacillus natechei]
MQNQFEQEITKENMEVSLEDLNDALSPEDFGEAALLGDKVY